MLAQFNLSHTAIIPSLWVEPQRSVTLTHEGPSTLKGQHLCTNDLTEYKSWIGCDDTTAPRDYWTLPSRPWKERYVESTDDLSPQELEDLERAGWAYLFGNSAVVSSYRGLLEHLRAPFYATLYAVDSIHIASNAKLVVAGRNPAFLLCNELVIENGGQLQIFTAFNARINHLIKS
jgi:hypothetical protein